ncbi:hypothetical protein K443DRAFT_177893 [Laccaria amethystina LaAM-08-1]|uniref:Uncharacterized protein n=1 Tax=Laccaria amethystina LaAM-08-1 TaxID=1095629 RepID=A0A0C9X2C9_9AGAR|nr:hypothetical protein K443DRAFT_177893 [Laccaria amethystina LaAM-08-1]
MAIKEILNDDTEIFNSLRLREHSVPRVSSGHALDDLIVAIRCFGQHQWSEKWSIATTGTHWRQVSRPGPE